jgi:hypothetical protein
MVERSNRPEGKIPGRPEFGFPKTVQMPPREDMVGRLEEVGVLGVSPHADRFYTAFVNDVADKEIVGPGLHMSWTLATADTLSDLPPIIGIQIGMEFDRVVEAVTPDLEVARQAKDFRRQVFESMRRQQGQ